MLPYAIAAGAVVVAAAAYALMRPRRRTFRGRTVVITGASSGIGEYIAFEYAREGAALVLAARRVDRLEQVAAKCRELGAADVVVAQTDVTKFEQCGALMQAALDKFGSIDLLVLNAGMSSIVPFEDVRDLKGYRDLMELKYAEQRAALVCSLRARRSYWGYVNCVFHALPALRRSRGAILAISSLAGKFGSALRTGYSPTKFAVQGFLDALRCELGAEIQITIVCPGYVYSEIHDKALGVSAKRDQKQFMSTDECARRIHQAVATRRRELVMSTSARVALVLRHFMPGLIDYLATRKATRGVHR